MNDFRLRYFSRLFAVATMTIMFCRCANIVSPVGGERDITPPKVVKAIPPDETINFNSKKIIITFDEFIQLRDIYSQFIASPPLKNVPDIKIRDKSLYIHINDTLDENTTYSLYFGDAIADFTEGNKIRGFRYVFSTGSFLDSLQLNGKVVLAQTGAPEKDILVMLYVFGSNDSVPMKERPLYMAKTSDDGSFSFKNLGTDTYKLFALKDANSNFMYDLPNELIGYLSEAAVPFYQPPPDTSNTDSVEANEYPSLEVLLFLEEDSVQKMLRAGMSEYNRFTIAFRYPVSEPVIKPFSGTSEIEYVQEIYKNNDTLVLWFTSKPPDSLKAFVYDADVLIDTILAGTEFHTRRGVLSFNDMKSLPLKSNISARNLPFFEHIILEAPRPISELKPDSFMLTTEKDSIIDTLLLTKKNFEKTGLRSIAIDYSWDENSKYTLVILPGAVIDIYGLTNDTMKMPFTTSGSELYGIMKLDVNVPLKGADYILELMHEEKTGFSKFYLNLDTMLTITNIPPGKYSIKCVIDANSNGKWDSGNYLRGIQPEKTFYSVRDIQIIQNWEMELEITLEYPEMKEKK